MESAIRGRLARERRGALGKGGPRVRRGRCQPPGDAEGGWERAFISRLSARTLTLNLGALSDLPLPARLTAWGAGVAASVPAPLAGEEAPDPGLTPHFSAPGPGFYLGLIALLSAPGRGARLCYTCSCLRKKKKKNFNKEADSGKDQEVAHFMFVKPLPLFSLMTFPCLDNPAVNPAVVSGACDRKASFAPLL